MANAVLRLVGFLLILSWSLGAAHAQSEPPSGTQTPPPIPQEDSAASTKEGDGTQTNQGGKPGDSQPADQDAELTGGNEEPEWVGDDFEDWDADSDSDSNSNGETYGLDVLDEEEDGAPRKRKRRRKRKHRAPGYGGTLVLGLSVNIDASGGEVSVPGQQADINDESSFNLAPELGYFLTDNWVLQAGLSLSGSAETSSNSLAKIESGGVGLFAGGSYYGFLEGRSGVFLFAESNVSVFRGQIEERNSAGELFVSFDCCEIPWLEFRIANPLASVVSQKVSSTGSLWQDQRRQKVYCSDGSSKPDSTALNHAPNKPTLLPPLCGARRCSGCGDGLFKA